MSDSRLTDAASNSLEALTPAMRQYRAAKQSYPDALLLFRMGDFYELFYEDAVVAARELQLTLTARDKARAVPMCGVPYHAADAYIQRLLRRGFRVAICEQMEDPKQSKGVVKREVTRVLSPGTSVDPALSGDQSNWLASIAPTGGRGKSAQVGLALLDLSTGEFRATEFTGEAAWTDAVDELGRVRPVELLYPEDNPDLLTGGKSQLRLGREPAAAPAANTRDTARSDLPSISDLEAIRTRTPLAEALFSQEFAQTLLKRHFNVNSVDGMGLGGREAATSAAGAVLAYLGETKQGALQHLDSLRFYERSGSLEIDAVSVRNLDLVDPSFAGDGPQTTLFWTMDSCLTPMGRRLLRSTLLRPANIVAEIRTRLDAVGEAVEDLRRRETLRRSLDGVLDLERLLGRVALDSAGPREVMALAVTIGRLRAVKEATTAFTTARWQELGLDLDPLDDLLHRIVTTLADQPPSILADGGVIREGVLRELDDLRTLGRDGRGAIAAIEDRERARTGIGSLKVRFNNVFGYYLEVTRANSKAVPPDYERKQTLVNAERFTTPELKELESKILTAEERSLEIERRLFAELRAAILTEAARIRGAARRVAEIDMLAAFAHLAVLRGWVRPKIDESGLLEFAGARHPVIERRLEESGAGRFVPNSISVQAAQDLHAPHPEPRDTPPAPSLLLITGPNMGGKSTYLRMAALLVIMAQIGSFVPAEQMHLGLVDRIYTRIGASDNVARGRSTFMVEMTETAAILNTATSQSLVLLDEMGRGTSTYDGLSLAWATVEHIHHRIGARALFATHYHELTMLEQALDRLKNLRVTVKESSGGIVFLHAVEVGAASKSYGIDVARLAGLPAEVIGRAREVLKVHERAEAREMEVAGAAHASAAAGTSTATPMQMTMFTPLSQRIVDRLAAVELDETTPREALNLLAELQRELRG